MKIAYPRLAAGILGCSLAFGAPFSSGGLQGADAAAQAAESAGATARPPAAARTRSGLVALYDFRADAGAIVKDRAGVGEPVDLRITNMDAVRRAEGSLEVHGKTLIRSEGEASRISAAVRRSGEITIEAWLRPADDGLSGPARIVTLSRNSGERNFTLGQDGDRFDVRLRTTQTSENGIPSLGSTPASLKTALTHVVYTRDRTGRTRIYINGEPSIEKTIAGSTTNWIGSHRLALANELSRDRPWQGTYYLVAIYSRDLLRHEVEQHFEAGASAEVALVEETSAPGARLFAAEIAPLLARHCLECHDGTAKKGRLDLSRQESALAGGRSGKVIAPGKSAESLLWELVESDEMPEDRPALAPEEKRLLREWIDAGAVWSGGVIDPSTSTRERRAFQPLVRRLTVAEYIETVRSAVGVDVAESAREVLPEDLRADGFTNTAYNLGVDLEHVEAYAKLAESIVEKMDAVAFASEYTECRKLTEDCMRTLISRMGKWLLRGPLEDHEITAFHGVATAVAGGGGDFADAVRHVIEAMLQSPRFIYRIENQHGDGTAWPVGDYELASRLSYALWGGPPDRELMRAADAGELYDREGVGAQVRRMLEDPRAVERSSRFVREWLDLDRLENLRPNPERFPTWSSELAADMRAETLAFFEDVVWKQKRPLTHLLNAQVTYATPHLAEHYGLEPRGDGLQRYDLSSIPARGGLLTQGSALTVGGDEASMVARGLFVLHDILRGSVKDPPPCVDTTPVPTQPGLSQRGIAEARIADPACGGCHAKFEPLAFGLERFDGVGAYHDTDDHGNALRHDGEILFPEDETPVGYDSSAELMDLLAGSGRVSECLTWKLTQFALGRPLVQADVPVLDKIHAEAQNGGGTYVSLITAIVMSDLVQTTRTETAE